MQQSSPALPQSIETPCGNGGTLIIDAYSIRIERKGFIHGNQDQSMPRQAYTGMNSVQVSPSLFGLGGAVKLTFYGQGGYSIVAGWVKPKVAEQIKQMLKPPIPQPPYPQR